MRMCEVKQRRQALNGGVKNKGYLLKIFVPELYGKTFTRIVGTKYSENLEGIDKYTQNAYRAPIHNYKKFLHTDSKCLCWVWIIMTMILLL